MLIITAISSHPLVVLRRNNLFRNLGLTETMLQQITHSDAPTSSSSSTISSSSSPSLSVGFAEAVSLCRRALCLFFNVGLCRVLECHGSPFKRASSSLQSNGTHIVKVSSLVLYDDEKNRLVVTVV